METELRLRLDLATFDDDQRFADSVARCHRAGVSFVTLASLGDTEPSRRRLHALNRECSRDRPAGGRFRVYEEYAANLIERPEYLSDGTFVAVEGDEWVGMVMLSDGRERNFLFNDMTGVIESHRRRGIATALKLLSIRFARSTGRPYLFTFNYSGNAAAIELNRRFGFVDVGPEEWWPLSEGGKDETTGARLQDGTAG